MRKGKQLSFDGESIFCGLDVHKKNWRVNIRSAEFELEDYSQDPSTEILINHLNKNYPGAKVKVAYEAGFCGFGIERSLKAKGIECLVVNPADVPTWGQREKEKAGQRRCPKDLQMSAGRCPAGYLCSRPGY